MANTATLGILRLLLTANSVELKTELEKARRTVDNFAKDLRSIGQQAQSVGKTLTAALTLPILGVGVASAKAAVEFESSFANVAKTVDGVSDKFGKLTPKGEALAMTFRQMAKEIPATTDELTAIAALGGQMGVPIDQLAKFTRNVAALGIAVDGISTEAAASGLAAIGNATGQGTTKIAEMASALVHLGNNANATEGQILEFSKRLIGAGNAVGMTVPDVMALGTAMANVGIEAEAGGTAMSVVIGKISKAVSKGGEALDEFAKAAGVSSEAFAAAWKKSPIEALDLFIKGLGTMKARGVDLNLTMGELGTEGIRVADALKRLSGATQSIADTSKLANEGYAAANKHLEEAQKKYATTEKQLTLLWNRIKDVGITIGNALIPGIKASIQLLEGFLPLIDGLAKAFAALPGAVQMIVIGLFGLVAAAGPALIIFGKLATSAADIAALFGKKGLATRALAGDFGTLAGATGKVTTALGLLKTATIVAGTAFAAWELGRLIADLLGLDNAIARVITREGELEDLRRKSATGAKGQADVAKQLADLERQRSAAIAANNFEEIARLHNSIELIRNDQTRLAIEDSITAAIKRGADANITYAGAVKFNEEWLKKKQTTEIAAAATTQATTATQAKAVSLLTELNAKYAADLKKIGTSGFKEILTAHDTYGKSVKDLAEKYGVAESSIEHFLDKQKDVAKAIKEADAPLDAFAKKAAALETALRAAEAAGVPMVLVLEEYGTQIEDLTHKAPIFEQMARDTGKAFDGIGEATRRAAEELKKGQIEKAAAKMFEQLNDQARQMVEEWKKAGEEAAAKFVGSFDRQSKEFLSAANQVQTSLVAQDEDSLDKRLTLVTLEFEAKRLALDQYDTFHDLKLQAINLDEQKAADAATMAWADHIADVKAQVASYPNIFKSALSGIPGLIQSALTGGGGLSGGLQAALSGVGGMLGKRLFTDIAAKGSSALFSVFGTGITEALGAVIPGLGQVIGTFIGPLAAKLGGGLMKLFGGGDDGDKQRDEFFKSVEGGFDGVGKKLHQLGAEGDKLFNQLLSANSGKKAAAAIEQIKVALEKADKANAQLNTDLGVSLTKIRDLGGKLPDALKAYLEQLKAAGRLTQENIDLLGILSDTGTVNWKAVEEAANRYGISTDKLGSVFNELKLHETWQQMIDDIALFASANVDVNGLLSDMADEISAAVQRSQKFGTEIPENMRPWIEKLIESGQLLDENGDKITDISKLHFGATLQTTLEKLNNTLELLLKNILGIGPAIDKAPKSVDIDVNYREHRFADENTGPEAPAFARGTPGLDYGSFGGQTIAALHGREAVIPQSGVGDLAGQIARALSAGAAMTPASTYQAVSAGAAALRAGAIDQTSSYGPFVLQVPPGELYRAMRDGAPIVVDAINGNHLGSRTQSSSRGQPLGRL